MNRRHATKVILALWAGINTRAHAQARIPIIGVPLITASTNDVMMLALRRSLSARGLEDGKHIRLEHRAAQGSVVKLADNIDELIRLGTDIFVTGNETIARAVQKAVHGTTPIVLVAWDYDPVETGLIQSLSHPGGNITGISTRSTELIGKRLELLRDLLPKLKRVAVLYDDFGEKQLRYFDAPAVALGLELKRFALHPAYDYDLVFKGVKTFDAGAVVVTFSPKFWVDKQRVAQLALKHRIPSISYEAGSVREGALLSYGPDTRGTWGRAAYFIERILKGEKPSDLPVEQPDLFTLAVNFKTAKTLGLNIPESIMIRVNEPVK